MGYSSKYSSPQYPCGWLNPQMQNPRIQGAWGPTLRDLSILGPWYLQGVLEPNPPPNPSWKPRGNWITIKCLEFGFCLFSGVCHFSPIPTLPITTVPSCPTMNPPFSQSQCKIFRQNYLHLSRLLSAHVASAYQIIDSLPQQSFHRRR